MNTVLLRALDLLGVAVFAISGALAGIAAQFDLLGICVLASATAVGGGTIRDLLLNRHPIFWIRDSWPIFTIVGATALTLPLIFRQDIYASAAIAGIAVYLLLRKARVPAPVAVGAGFATVVCTRLIAITYDLRLPTFELPS